MRISDWSSDVCSSDLQVEIATDKRWHTCAVDLPSTDVSRRNTLRYAQCGDLGPIWPVAVNATPVARIASARLKIVATRSSAALLHWSETFADGRRATGALEPAAQTHTNHRTDERRVRNVCVRTNNYRWS